MIWAPADINRKSDHRHPILERVCRYQANESADEDDKSHTVFFKPDGFGQALNRKWAIGIDLLVASLVRLVRGIYQLLCGVEFRHQSIARGIGDRRFINRNIAHWFTSADSCTSASGSKVRNSKIEIAGSRRTNSHIPVRNSPTVPASVIQSHLVG